MKSGEILESGSPDELLRNARSTFHSMAIEAGIAAPESDSPDAMGT